MLEAQAGITGGSLRVVWAGEMLQVSSEGLGEGLESCESKQTAALDWEDISRS